MKRLALSDIGEVLLDSAAGLVQLRLYNVTVDLELTEWEDLVSMIQQAAPKTGRAAQAGAGTPAPGAAELLGGALGHTHCPSCGEGITAFFTGGTLSCPACGHTFTPKGGTGRA